MKLPALTLLLPLVVTGCLAPPATPEARMARYLAGQQALANIRQQQGINAANNAAIYNTWMQGQNPQPLQLESPQFSRSNNTYFINTPNGTHTVRQIGNSYFTN